MELTFHSHVYKTHFHKKCWALGLILKVRVLGTRKFWRIRFRKFKVVKYEPRLLITWNSCLCNGSINCSSVSYKFVDGRIELNTNLTKSTNKQTRITGYKICAKNRGILGVMPFLLIKCPLHLSLQPSRLNRKCTLLPRNDKKDVLQYPISFISYLRSPIGPAWCHLKITWIL